MQMEFHRSRPGAAFCNGKVILFRSGEIIVIRQWPQIMAWRKTATQGWRAWRPQLPPRLVRLKEPQINNGRNREQHPLQLGSSDDNALDPWAKIKMLRQRRFAEAAWQFSRPIPEAVRRMVRTFNQSQYEMLQAAAAIPYAMQLYHSNPALLFALIRNDQFFIAPPRERLAASRRWILHKQHDIAAWLGFPEDAAKICVKILARLSPQDIRIHRLWWLRRMLADSDLRKLFAFAPRIDATVIGFVWDLKEILNARLAGKLVARLDSKALLQARMIGRDIVRMWRLLERPWPPAKKICGINAMEELHYDLWRNCERRARNSGLEIRLLEKPLPEWPDIELLGTTREIVAEGEEMNHCVASYICEMTSGAKPILLYRVRWPERATLRLSKAGEMWRIAELRCHRNQEPSPETFEFVKTWLNETQDMVADQSRVDFEIDPELCPF